MGVRSGRGSGRRGLAGANPSGIEGVGVMSRNLKRVTFLVPDDPELDERSRLDPDRDWQTMRRGQRWLLQTYLRLHRAGYPVDVSGEVPREGLLVFHSKHRRWLRRRLTDRRDLVLVGIRGDNSEALCADYEVVQNGRFADDKRRFFVAYWPQPGLLPRDPARGARV